MHPKSTGIAFSAQVVRGVEIITAAVDRYKELCEGRCQGELDVDNTM